MALVALWILFSAWLCAVGWILSALNALNGPGYLVALAVTMAGAWIFNKSWWPAGGRRWPNWRKLGRRFRRPAPLMILVIALLGLAGGLESAPENGDSNAYRVPRVLQWLSQAGWHWIRTEDARENVAGCAYAWFFAPLLLLTHNARWIFLPNLITYFLLPGQLFNFFRRLKIESRVAWWWTWLLAAGWCYTLQACSTNDDSLASVYALAALAYALRAREENSFGGLWLSLLAAALMTAVKPTNLPLLLPCFIAAYPSWRLLLTRPLASAGLIVFGVLASFLPLAILCWRHTGSWKGYQLESGPAHWWHYGPTQELASPFWGFLGNTFCLTAQNLLPPFFPWASAWNQAMQFFLQTSFGAHFASFEKFGRLSRSVSPTSAGLGLHIVFMVLVTVIFLIIVRRSRATICPVARPAIYRWLQWTPWLALVPFMAKVGSYQNARFLAPYYPLLLLVLLARPGVAVLVRRRWWQRLLLMCLAATLAFMIFEHGRAFVPASVVARLQTIPHLHGLKVLDDYYLTRKTIADYRAFTAHYADGEAVVGYATICGGLEPGMWQPWGHGRVERILPDDTPDWVRSRGIHRVFIDDFPLAENHETIEQWLQRFHATLLGETTYSTDPGAPRTHLYVVRLLSPGEPPPSK